MRLSFLLLAAVLWDGGEGFTSTECRRRPSFAVRKAIIYGGDWLEEPTETAITTTTTTMTTTSSLANVLAQNHVGALARLAVAFSPQERALRLKNIEQVGVMGLDDHHIDIEAVVCEDDGCVTLAVPVQFDFPCPNDDDMEACVIENLTRLDSRAESHIQQMEFRLESEQEDAETMQQLIAQEYMDMPAWWVSPVDEMLRECDNLRGLLNQQDFREETRALAASIVQNWNLEGYEYHVVRAGVVAVSPAGIYMRTNLHFPGFEGKDANRIIDVQSPFQAQAQNVDELRNTILDAIAVVTPTETPQAEPTLADYLSRYYAAPLARIVVAFSPRTLTLNDVETVRVMGVDGHHLDIEAVVREGNDQTTLTLPVPFSHQCVEGNETAECVIGNIQMLDAQAQDIIQSMEPQEEDAYETWRRLTSRDNMNLPPWWALPMPDLVEECENLCALLNQQDLREQTTALAASILQSWNMDGHDCRVEQAGVVAISPVGIYMRAKVHFEGKGADRIVEVHSPFQAEAKEPSQLRKTIFDAIAVTAPPNTEVQPVEEPLAEVQTTDAAPPVEEPLAEATAPEVETTGAALVEEEPPAEAETTPEDLQATEATLVDEPLVEVPTAEEMQTTEATSAEVPTAEETLAIEATSAEVLTAEETLATEATSAEVPTAEETPVEMQTTEATSAEVPTAEETPVETWLEDNEPATLEATVSSLADFLSQNYSTALERMVVASTPQDRVLALDDVEKVKVADVDFYHIDIEAVIREGDGHTTVTVPMEFKNLCINDDEMEECIIDNIERLEKDANSLIKEIQYYHDSSISPLAKFLSFHHVGGLARMVVTHSPQEKATMLKDIKNVKVKEVDDHHIEMEAVVREGDGKTVTIPVPVKFDHQCVNDDEMEECIIDNVERLEKEADSHIEKAQNQVDATLLTMANFLSEHLTDPLMKMAVAFSPKGKPLTMDNIEELKVTELDGQHIEMEAVIREEDSRVAFPVPLEFDNECLSLDGDEMEECIVDNLDRLDSQAEDLMKETQSEATSSRP